MFRFQTLKKNPLLVYFLKKDYEPKHLPLVLIYLILIGLMAGLRYFFAVGRVELVELMIVTWVGLEFIITWMVADHVFSGWNKWRKRGDVTQLAITRLKGKDITQAVVVQCSALAAVIILPVVVLELFVNRSYIESKLKAISFIGEIDVFYALWLYFPVLALAVFPSAAVCGLLSLRSVLQHQEKKEKLEGVWFRTLYTVAMQLYLLALSSLCVIYGSRVIINVVLNSTGVMDRPIVLGFMVAFGVYLVWYCVKFIRKGKLVSWKGVPLSMFLCALAGCIFIGLYLIDLSLIGLSGTNLQMSAIMMIQFTTVQLLSILFPVSLYLVIAGWSLKFYWCWRLSQDIEKAWDNVLLFGEEETPEQER